MKIITLLFSSFLLLASSFAVEKQPNIVFLLIDDLGYADCGFNGGKDIHTPNIDKLAAGGTVREEGELGKGAEFVIELPLGGAAGAAR